MPVGCLVEEPNVLAWIEVLDEVLKHSNSVASNVILSTISHRRRPTSTLRARPEEWPGVEL